MSTSIEMSSSITYIMPVSVPLCVISPKIYSYPSNATAERYERDYIWNLFTQCLNQNKHGELFLNYFGDVESVGV